MSWSGLCAECGRDVLLTNIDGLHYKRGEPLRRWRVGMILAAGGVLPDTLDNRHDAP